MKKSFLLVSAFFLIAVSSMALPPLNEMPETDPGYFSPETIDNQTYINANNILTFITNTGGWGRDISGVFGYDAGFFFPYTSIENIEDGTNANYCIYASGIWLGGKINGETHVAVAEYTHEYVPGPMENGTYLPDNPLFRTYKIDASSGPGDPDYDEWPFTQGAPVDPFAHPLLIGDQTLWAVFNDADADQHENNSGNTAPMGVEIQLTSWGSDDPNEENIIYLKYKLYNKGSNYIDSFYFSMWFDPDVGGSSDDYVGCDSINNIFFAYNSTNNDHDYGSTPPAVGGILVSGPVVPAPGETAIFDGHPLPDYRNIGMSSFNKYINGIDPDDAIESYNYMRGFNRDGSPVIYHGSETKYVCSGDPVTGTGWVDGEYTPASDRRMMANFGPFTFNPGDSQQVVIRIGAAMGSDRLESVAMLKDMLLNCCPENPAEITIDPEPIYAFMKYPNGSMNANIIIPDDATAFSIMDADLSSLIINGNISPTSAEILYADSIGDYINVLVDLPEFINSYPLMWDIVNREYTIGGSLISGGDFLLSENVTTIGHISGDVNGDLAVNLMDITYGLNYLYHDGAAPRPFVEILDVNADGNLNILDATYLIKYLYDNGPAPKHPDL